MTEVALGNMSKKVAQHIKRQDEVITTLRKTLAARQVEHPIVTVNPYFPETALSFDGDELIVRFHTGDSRTSYIDVMQTRDGRGIQVQGSESFKIGLLSSNRFQVRSDR